MARPPVACFLLAHGTGSCLPALNLTLYSQLYLAIQLCLTIPVKPNHASSGKLQCIQRRHWYLVPHWSSTPAAKVLIYITRILKIFMPLFSANTMNSWEMSHQILCLELFFSFLRPYVDIHGHTLDVISNCTFLDHHLFNDTETF